MRRVFRLVVSSFVIAALWAASVPAATQVRWAEASYKEVLAKAKAENKHVFIDFYAVWCGPCKQLEKVTYTDPKVEELLNAMIPAKWDAEKGEGIELAKEFRIGAYPTLVLLSPDGEEIDRFLGFLEPADFIRVFTDYQNGVGTVAYYEAKVTGDPKDAGSWKTLGMKYVDAGRSDEAKAALRAFLDLSPGAGADEKAQVTYALGEASYRSGSYDEAVAIFDKVANEFEGTPWAFQAVVMGANASFKKGDKEKSVQTYMSYAKRHPDDVEALNAFAWFCASKKVGMAEALPYAEKAVELSNRDPGVLDTLAELHYAMGSFDKAIAIGEEALKKSPEDAYLAEQVAKFKKAKAGGK
jgi:tetratricopeptide (TPR) repeat protein